MGRKEENMLTQEWGNGFYLTGYHRSVFVG